MIEHHNNMRGGNFIITNTNLHVRVVTLSINDNINFLENIKQGFKRTIFWNKYRSEITAQPESSNLDYLLYSIFRKINILFVLPLKNFHYNSLRDPFDEYFMPLIELKDFKALIGNKKIFDQPVKIKQEAYENLSKCQEIMIMQQETY